VDEVLPDEGLKELLAHADYVALAVAATPETSCLIGEAELKAMKPGAFLINIARGTIINEGDLIDALREERIGGVGLDVFATEPLPADSELYNFDNVIMTAHRAGFTHHMLSDERIVNFLENLEDYRHGRPLRTLVNKQLGY
jgi:phosphoglycerate dehydrogenase-like enzyme